MTSLPVLIAFFAVSGIVLTALTMWAKKTKHPFLTFLQHFTGVWFIFSGLVKAIDPIGTAYKMEDYFREFESTFAGLQNGLKGLAPVFPWLTQYGAGFSIIMIVLEIALGLMLILGYARRTTAWLFFLIVLFFTFLTGFTYLTGFAPSEANFFDFAKWGPFAKTQMRVTDCGCFGDFIKLDPRTSFFKDVFLMFPAVYFLLRSKKMHQLFTASGRRMFTWLTIAGSTLFSLYNTYWDSPVVDFRPFKAGANLRERKALESKATTDILGWVLEDTINHKVVTYMEPEPNKFTYLKQYPKNQGWMVKKQIQSEMYVKVGDQRQPITKTKISDFAVENGENGEVTDDILQEPGYSLMIVAFHLDGQKITETITVQDPVYVFDTVRVRKDSVSITKRQTGTEARQEERPGFTPEGWYADVFNNKINPAAAAAKQAGWKVYAITTIGDAAVAGSFAEKIGADYPFYKADDKLLKTITRSNPGLVILKDGVVVKHYHWRHIPAAEKVVAN